MFDSAGETSTLAVHPWRIFPPLFVTLKVREHEPVFEINEIAMLASPDDEACNIAYAATHARIMITTTRIVRPLTLFALGRRLFVGEAKSMSSLVRRTLVYLS